MSEEFLLERKIDLQVLYHLQTEIEQIQATLLNYWFERPAKREIEQLEVEERLSSLIKSLSLCGLEENREREQRALSELLDVLHRTTPRHARARQFYSQLEQMVKRCKDAALDVPSEWWRTFDTVRQNVEGGLSNLRVILLREQTVPTEKLENVGQLFSSGTFDLLPYEARRDFEEAGRCFLYEQYKAAVMLAFRSTEKMAKAYFHRLTEQDERKATFEHIWQELNLMIGSERPDIINLLKNVTPIRNSFMHAESSVGFLDANDTKGYFELVTQLCSNMIEDLRQRHKLLSNSR